MTFDLGGSIPLWRRFSAAGPKRAAEKNGRMSPKSRYPNLEAVTASWEFCFYLIMGYWVHLAYFSVLPSGYNITKCERERGKKHFFPNYSFIFRSWSSHIMDSQCSSLYFPLIWGIIAAPTAPPPCAHTQKKQLALWCFILRSGWIRRHRDSTASLRWWRQQCLLLQ